MFGEILGHRIIYYFCQVKLKLVRIDKTDKRPFGTFWKRNDSAAF